MSNFAAGQAVTVKRGYGFWDITHWPYGGSFHRRACDEPGHVIGPGVHPHELTVNISGHTIVIPADALEPRDA